MTRTLFTTLTLAGALWACTGSSPTPTDTDTTDTEVAAATTCEDCLEQGGTWQPEAEQCTADCDLMDISCFRDTCPGECSEDCGSCFNQTECEAASCTWRVEAETMWCTT
jgi:hypothetical protein